MSKFGNMLNMIIYLKSNGKTTIKELARELEVDERMIRKYRDDLEQAGIYIESIRGVNGGYVLQGDDYLLNLSIDEDEMSALQLANELLKNQEFIYYKEFQNVLNKINNIRTEKVKEFERAEYVVKDTKNIDLLGDRRKCLDINKAILCRQKIKMNYFSLNAGESSERIVHPYAVYTYKGALYIAAFCERSNMVKYFKLSRIKGYEILNDKFQRLKEFSLKEIMKNAFGIYRDETLNVKLKIEKPMSYIVSEKLWVDNQKIIWNKDESIIFEASMSGKVEIISWILSMGSKVKVLEPKELVEDVKKELDDINKKYIVS